MSHTAPIAGPSWVVLAAGLILASALAACSSAASTTPSASTTASMSVAGAVSTAPSVSIAPSPSGPLRCAATPDASPSATIEIITDSLGIFNFGDPVTIKAGQAVAFTNGNGAAHTITEGTYGEPTPNACVNEPIALNATVIVTFYLPGDYQITCKPHPILQTSVVVE
jgi:plastocyanin